MELLDFELELKELYQTLEQLKEIGANSDIDISSSINDVNKKIEQKKFEIYSNLSSWQKVEIARHPQRPFTLNYIKGITDGNFIELHGDRKFADDTAIVGGFGQVDNKTYMFIGQQKGENTKMRQYRNFGMPNPEGYRKALRLMQLAEKFNIPIVTFVDTPGAYPGIGAEERGQAEAIARNMYEMFKIKVPIISIIIGEGASGGAIAIAVADKVFMLEYTWYSVISPESCSQILWRSWEYKKRAAQSLKLTADDMLNNNLIDEIIKEPFGGAHNNHQEIINNVKKIIINEISLLSKLSTEELLKNRINKFVQMGVYNEK